MQRILTTLLVLALGASGLRAQQLVEVGMAAYGEVITFSISDDGKTATDGDGNTYDCKKQGDDLVIDGASGGAYWGTLYLRKYYTKAKEGQLDDHIGPELGYWKKIELAPSPPDGGRVTGDGPGPAPPLG